MKSQRIGIALGGGGSRGFAHLGVLEALREKGIFPDVIAGTSAGSIVGALMAAGKTPGEIMSIMKENKLGDYAKIGLPTEGFMSLDGLKEQLESTLPSDDFHQLKHKLIVAVSNLLTGQVEYLSEGSISLAVQASSSIPILFSPVEINGQWYVDGGLLDNLPVKPLLDVCDKIIAVDVMPLEKLEKLDGITEVAARVFQISVVSRPDEHMDDCDLVIRLEELENYQILDTDHADEIYEIGYNYVKNLDLSALSS
ncbi:NTE family protein [Tindallia magadiensis]|uniref:NTE family protein n=1 Tax=Tindallia magadiensis TaxID=69895 RepID=A0A1I3HTK6_9FIRM|nr:patatin-like phospholipase family protein [Tindallia magadiensis]SFI39012.1 NTE family protein [Tindallia magadiensis]